jgi:hypothetical protein
MRNNLEFPIMMSQCFWCGKSGDEILIGMRAVTKNTNRPQLAFVGYEPCKKCTTAFSRGIRFVEVADSPQFDKQPEIQQGFYPTGKIVVLREEVVDGFLDHDMAIEVKKARAAMLNPETFQDLFGDIGNKELEETTNEDELNKRNEIQEENHD